MVAANDMPPKAVTNFKATEYLGTWYEIARLPLWFERKCIAPITANYTFENGDIIVLNKCLRDNGEYDTANGVAEFEQESSVAILKVSFVPGWLRWTGIGKGDYWVLYTDYTQIALVGSPDYKYLWVLSRNEHPESQIVTKMINYAQELGYPTQSLIYNYNSDTNESYAIRY